MVVAILAIGGAGVARAVSGGPYSPGSQGCPPNADANNTQTATPGCHSSQALVSDGSGHHYLEEGTQQSPQGQAVEGGSFAVSPNGGATPQGAVTAGPGVTGTFDTNYQPGSGKPPSRIPSVSATIKPGSPGSQLLNLLTGAQLYYGADDNLDVGEHDGADGQNGTANSVNGPSDGGAIVVNWHPLDAAAWLRTVLAGLAKGDLAPAAENPVGVADAGVGFCADGICAGVYSNQRTIYQGGGGSGPSRDVYNYQGKTWGPYDCSSGDAKSEQACITQGGHPMDYYRQREAGKVQVEPGVMVFEDPDRQGSTALSPALYPLPAFYLGTCGVVVGGGPAAKMPASPITNSAGQLVLNPTHC
jgi:hypothetical protein